MFSSLLCLAQIRLTDGSRISNEFAASATIADVFAFVSQNRTDGGGPYELMTTYPRKTYGFNDQATTLKDVGKRRRGRLTVV